MLQAWSMTMIFITIPPSTHQHLNEETFARIGNTKVFSSPPHFPSFLLGFMVILWPYIIPLPTYHHTQKEKVRYSVHAMLLLSSIPTSNHSKYIWFISQNPSFPYPHPHVYGDPYCRCIPTHPQSTHPFSHSPYLLFVP